MSPDAAGGSAGGVSLASCCPAGCSPGVSLVSFGASFGVSCGGAAAAAASKADAKPEVGRLPVIDSWVLQDVSRGGALIEGRQGVYEVYAGDVVPGLGRIDAVRRQDGRWVVVTSRGLIVAR